MTEDYVTMLLNTSIDRDNFAPLLTILFLFLARFLPIIALSPFFGARVLPHPVKVVFALTMWTIFLPLLLQYNTTTLGFNPLSVLLLCKELFIGLMIGLVISMPFVIVQSAGIIIDHQRGGASLMVNDPTIQNQSSPLGTLFNMVLIYIFFLIDGPFIFLDAIMTSYEIVPPDQFFGEAFFRHGNEFWNISIKVFNRVMVMSIQLATPGLIAILMTDVFLGIANRLAPQVQITFLGMPLKSLLGLGVVCIGWKLLVEEFARESHFWLDLVKEMIQTFRIGKT